MSTYADDAFRFEAAVNRAAASGAGQSRYTEWFWVELALVRERWRPTRHPFLDRLEWGELPADELAVFVSEHDHVLVAVAELARRAVRMTEGLLADALAEHARAGESAITRWRRLAREVGWSGHTAMYYAEDPYEGTTTCARLIDGAGCDVAGHLVTLHGLACADHELWTALDRRRDRHRPGRADAGSVERRAAAREAGIARLQAAVEGALDRADPFAVIARGGAVARAYWHLLDDIEADRHRRAGGAR